MIFNCEENHPYRKFIEHINQLEQNELISDYLNYITEIDFGKALKVTANKIIIKYDDLNNLAQVMNSSDFILFIGHRYIDTLRELLLKVIEYDVEIYIRIGEFRERLTNYLTNLNKDLVHDIKNTFIDPEHNFDHYSNLNNLNNMNNIFNHSSVQMDKQEALERICGFYFENNQYHPKINMTDSQKFEYFNSQVLSDISQIMSPEENFQYLGFIHMPINSIVPHSNLNMIKELRDKIQKHSDEAALISKTLSDENKEQRKKVDNLKMFPKFYNRKDYLNLDEKYKKRNNTKDWSRKLDAFRKQKKREYPTFHSQSQEEWIETADVKKKDKKRIGHANGIITLCYWRLYYYNNDLFEDLKKLDQNINHNYFLDIMERYHQFVDVELLSTVVDTIEKNHRSNVDKVQKEIITLNNDIDYTFVDSKNQQLYDKNKKKRTSLTTRQDNLKIELQKLKTKTWEIKKYCSELIKMHFNFILVNQILEGYLSSEIYHEELLKKYNNEQKIVTLNLLKDFK